MAKGADYLISIHLNTTTTHNKTLVLYYDNPNSNSGNILTEHIIASVRQGNFGLPCEPMRTLRGVPEGQPTDMNPQNTTTPSRRILWLTEVKEAAILLEAGSIGTKQFLDQTQSLIFTEEFIHRIVQGIQEGIDEIESQP